MLKVKKYKIFCNLKTFIYVLPRIRLLKFKRPKWKSLQSSLTKSCIWPVRPVRDVNSKEPVSLIKVSKPGVCLDNLLFNASAKEQRLKKFYKNSLILKQTMSVFFYHKLLTSDFKKLMLNQSKYKARLWLDTLIKPLYVLEILLCKLGFFKTIFELRQSLIKHEIFVNSKVAVLNMVVKQGDVITMPNIKFKKNTNLPMVLFPIVEVDYYSNSVIILIDYLKFNMDTLPVFYPERLDLNQLVDYIKNK